MKEGKRLYKLRKKTFFLLISNTHKIKITAKGFGFHVKKTFSFREERDGCSDTGKKLSNRHFKKFELCREGRGIMEI